MFTMPPHDSAGREAVYGAWIIGALFPETWVVHPIDLASSTDYNLGRKGENMKVYSERLIGGLMLLLLSVLSRYLPESVYEDWADTSTRATMAMTLFVGAVVLICLSIKVKQS